MNKTQIITLGGNGLIGERVTELLLEEFEFINLSRKNGLDISNSSTLTKLKDYSSNFVINFAAKADVDGCEKDKDLGEIGDAWKINSQGPQNVAEICRELGKKIIHISTDFVFDGTTDSEYTENDSPNPVNWYGLTKYEGEKKIEESGADYVIIRPAYPYRANFSGKLDFYRAIKSKLEKNEEIMAVTDHYFCPTFIDDIAMAIKVLIKTDSSGIYHVVGSEKITPYNASLMIAHIFGFDESLIKKTTREEFFKAKASRPFNLALSNAKISELGIRMSKFEEGLHRIKTQLQ